MPEIGVDEHENALCVHIRQKWILRGGIEATEISKCLQIAKVGKAEAERIGTMVGNRRSRQCERLADGHDGVFRRSAVENGGIRNQREGGDDRRNDIGAFQCKSVVNGSDVREFTDVFRQFLQLGLKRQRSMINTCI